ncbi:MAG TPA: D-aminoacyl-tRNA deacylase [Bryobacteraceae bacterium]|jgi:D-tyrosyl-tRNA(Tyr) deacylase|nr:D-aminoacyl-tRNA deacylase [Bryobacteraceae bacterium]
MSAVNPLFYSQETESDGKVHKRAADMRALIQRVLEARVEVDGVAVGEIGRGLLVFLGIRNGDSGEHAELLSRKVIQLRIFPDEQGKMNRSLLDVSEKLLVVSQFTLYGDTRKGNRPSYSEAARPEVAKQLYEKFVELCRTKGILVETGRFQAHMNVYLVNDGPVTLLCDTD